MSRTTFGRKERGAFKMKVAQHYHIIQIELDWDFLYRKVAKIEFTDS
jgi:hypothetical protein